MKNSKQHSLHRLIHSMDASEKAYFKKFGFKRENKNNDSYIAIFNATDKQTEFDIQLLKKDKKINTSHKTNLHAALNSLFKILLQILVEYRKDKGNNTKLFNLIGELQVFQEKKLHDLAEKKYAQIEKMVEENKMYFFTPYVYQLKGNQLRNSIQADPDQLQVYFEKLDKSKEELEINIQVNKIGLKLEGLFHKNSGNKDNESIKEEADELIKNIDETMLISRNNFLFTSVLANNRFVVQMIFGRLQNLEEYMNEYYDYFDKNISTVLKENEIGDILITLKNYAVVSIYLKMQNSFEKAYDRLKQLENYLHSENGKELLSFRLLNLELLNFALHEGIPPTEKTIQKTLYLMENVFHGKAQFSEALLACMLTYFKKEKYERVLEISEKFIQGNHNDRIRDEFNTMKLIRALVWFKNESYEVYHSEITSIYRKIVQLERFPFQLYVVNQFKKLKMHPTLDEKEKIKSKLIKKCDEVLNKASGTEIMKAIELKTIALLALR